MVFADIAEVDHALETGAVTLHSKVTARVTDVNETGEEVTQVYETTPGRMKIGAHLPRRPGVSFEVCNTLLTKREISKLIDTVYRHCGQKDTVIFCDQVMGLGFHHAFKAGISFGMDDMVIPETKEGLVNETHALVKDYEQQYVDGLITQGEKYNKVVDTWAKCTDKVADEMMARISAVQIDEETKRQKPINSVYMMAHSGARGSPAQMKQLSRHARIDGKTIW